MKNGDEKSLGKLMDFLRKQKGNEKSHTVEGDKVNSAIDGVADGHFALVFDVGKVAVGSGFSGGSCGAFRRSCRGCAAAAGGQACGHAECQNGTDEFFHDTSSYTLHRSLTLPV